MLPKNKQTKRVEKQTKIKHTLLKDDDVERSDLWPNQPRMNKRYISVKAGDERIYYTHGSMCQHREVVLEYYGYTPVFACMSPKKKKKWCMPTPTCCAC